MRATVAPTALAELLRYLLCSALALAVDFGLYSMGLNLGLPYPAAASVGFLGGLALAYGLSVRWVFAVRAVRDSRAEFAIFAGVGLVGLALTEMLLWAQIRGLGIHPLMAKIVAAGGVFLFNFGARKAMLFRRSVRLDGGVT